MSGGKRFVKVISRDEVYYPVVRFLHTKAVEITETVEVAKTAAVTEAIESLAKTDKNETQEIINSTVLANTVKKTTETKQRRSRVRIWSSRLGTVVVSLVAICAVVLVGLRLAGFKIFTITSGSMEPDYPVGALIYVAPVDTNSLGVGDIITFMNSEETTVTHRITEVVTETNTAGEQVLRFRTKGDVNNTTDGKLVHYKNVVGTPVITIPILGYIAYYLQRPPGIYIALIVCTFLVSLIAIPYAMKFKRKEKTATVTQVSP